MSRHNKTQSDEDKGISKEDQEFYARVASPEFQEKYNELADNIDDLERELSSNESFQPESPAESLRKRESVPMIRRELEQAEQKLDALLDGYPIPSGQDGEVFKPLQEVEQEESMPPSVKPIREQQNEAVLSAIKMLGHDPQKMPPRQNGRRWVKADVWDKVQPTLRRFEQPVTGKELPSLFSKNSFNDAWQRLRDSGEIGEA